MKMMKSLTGLIFTAALVPALAVSTAAMASERDEMRSGEQQQRAGEQQQQRAGQQQGQAGEQYISSKPAGALYSDDVLGKTVKHRASGEDIGEIQELVIGDDGQIVGVVVTTGGFLGLGGQDVGLGWDHIEHSMEDDESVFFVDIDEETLKNAPEHERD